MSGVPPPAVRATVDGLAVVRRRPPAPAGPAVILVHGAMDRAASFGRVMRRLPELDVMALNRRGYADSLAAGVAPGLAAQADDVAAVAEWSGAERVAVVGHSLGGTVALAVAARSPAWLAALAVFECPLPAAADDAAAVEGSRPGDDALAVGRRDGPEAAAEHFYRLMVGDRTWERLRPADRQLRRSEGPALMAELEDLRHPVRPLDLGRVRVPVTVGCGAASSRHLRHGAAEVADLLGGAELVSIPGAGHGAHLSHPDEFARFVRRALARAGG